MNDGKPFTWIGLDKVEELCCAYGFDLPIAGCLNMQYESIEKADLKGCARVFVEVFNSPPWNEAWTANSARMRLTEIANTPGFIGIKALRRGELVGFVMGFSESYYDGVDFYIKEMCVLPSHQRKGVGRALLEELERGLVSNGQRKMYLLASRGTFAAGFYEQKGFNISERMIMMGKWLRPRD